MEIPGSVLDDLCRYRGAPRAVPALFRPFARISSDLRTAEASPPPPSAHILVLAFRSRRRSLSLGDPSLGHPSFSATASQVSHYPIHASSQSPGIPFSFIPSYFCFPSSEAAAPKPGSLAFSGCPSPPVACSASQTFTDCLPPLPCVSAPRSVERPQS